MAEEHRCEAPEGHRLCANNCGFFGSAATLDLCSKCYRDFRLKEEQASTAKSAVEKSFHGISPPTSSSSTSAAAVAVSPIPTLVAERPRDPVAVASLAFPSEPSVAAPAQPNRCSTCRKKVRLTGFRCRCGTTFCGAHRYPEQHGCTFDFKAAGREAIARANPVVKAEKLDKI